MRTSPEVDAWFEELDHPLIDVMQRVRQIILGADERMTETIKWKTPTFMYEGNLASFNPRAKSHVSLLFHAGASIPGDHPRLEGGGETARYMKIVDVDDAERCRLELESIVTAWISARDE